MKIKDKTDTEIELADFTDFELAQKSADGDVAALNKFTGDII